MIMTRFTKYGQDILLAITALFMIAGVVGFAWWGTVDMITAVNKALNTAPSRSDNVEINLDEAKKILRVRGLIQ